MEKKMKMIKKLIFATSIIASFAMSNAQANGFFKVESEQSYQQPNTFNEVVHEGTTFWNYYNKDLAKGTPKIDKVSSFDQTKHQDTYFWGVYSN